MTRLVVLMLIAIAAATAFTYSPLNGSATLNLELRVPASENADAHGETSVTNVQLPLVESVTLSADKRSNFRLWFDAQNNTRSGALSIMASGADFKIAVFDGDAYVRYTFCPKPVIKIATEQGAGEASTLRTCRSVLRLTANSTPTIVVYTPAGEAVIEDIQFELVASKYANTASSSLLFAGFAFLFLMGPIFVWLRQWPSIERWTTIVIGASWIGFAGLEGLLFALIFIAMGYLSIVSLKVTENKSLRKLGVVLTIIALALIFIKFVGPKAADAFANPGGFALALPLGISYFAIKLVDILLSVYSDSKFDIDLTRYLSFMLMPQTLPAGPILTYDRFRIGTIDNYSIVDFAAGGARMSVGLLKKLCADSLLYPIVGKLTAAYLAAGSEADPAIVLAMLFCNLAFVYIDFSAYSDLAIGAGRAAGRKIPENFDWPLVRNSIRLYWRHWHMSLSNWVMRRVYFPAFLSSRSTTWSLIASMMVIGLWHTPNLSWVAWSFHHGLGMALEGKLFGPAVVKLPWTETTKYKKFIAALRYMGGMVFVWVWVALGHAFTMFSNFEFAVKTYFKALAFPLSVFRFFG